MTTTPTPCLPPWGGEGVTNAPHVRPYGAAPSRREQALEKRYPGLFKPRAPRGLLHGNAVETLIKKRNVPQKLSPHSKRCVGVLGWGGGGPGFLGRGALEGVVCEVSQFLNGGLFGVSLTAGRWVCGT